MSTEWQPPNVPAPPAPPAPQPPRPNWFARHKILTVLLALVVVAILGKAFGSGDATPAATSPSAPVAEAPADAPKADAPKAEAPKAEQPDAPKGAKVGQTVRDGKFEFTVTKVEKRVAKVGNQYLNQKAQGQYVLVHVTVKNIGDEAQLFSDSSQKVRDAKGREFSADTSAAIYIEDNKVFLNEINPGNSVKGILVFDMPRDAAPATIELHDSPFSGGVTVRLG